MSPELQSSYKDIPFTTSDRSLTAKDQEWLSSYGVDASWQDDQRLVEELTLLIAIGSRRLDEPENQTIEAHTQIMTAREKFFKFVGVSDETLSFFIVESNHPTIIPLDTFIGTQRMFAQYGLNVSKVINKFPSAIGYAPETVKEKLDNLTSLGLNATKVINANPSALGLAPESVKKN